VSHRDLILSSSLERFARDGFLATSVQHIAGDAGVSKATVLYHFTSKEDLLEQAITPALDALQRLIDSVPADTALGELSQRAAFVDRFVPFLISNRQGIHIVVTHAHLAHSHPALTRAVGMMAALANIVERSSQSELDALRFGVALSGATYALVSETLLGMNTLPPKALEEGLRTVLFDMIVPAFDKIGEP